MGISSERLLQATNTLLQQYLQNGILPDELLIEQQLIAMFPSFYDATTGTFNVDVPLWQQTNLTYRQTSAFQQWNQTQLSAGQDTQIAYTDLLDNVNTMTNNLYDYVNHANLIKTRINKLVNRINNLLLISTSTDGFLFSFYDNFIDTSNVCFTTPYITTALVNTASQNVELATDITTSVSTAQTTDSILNLLFLQPSDVRFSILNSIVSQVGLSGAQLTDIFSNQATAWQQDITISGAGPLVCSLTVQISPLDPVEINHIEVFTRMTNYANQIMIQVLTSEDGVSYTAVDSPANPQYVGQVAEFNFTPVFASYVKFLITKNTADQGSTYNIGFQYINFQQVQYNLTADLYSVPIQFPDGHAINKVSVETCTVEPTNTGISYYIIRPSGIPIPISDINDENPQYPKVINLGALTDINAISSNGSIGYTWVNYPTGYWSLNVQTLAGTTTNINLTDSTISNTMSIWRNVGPGTIAVEPSGLLGWQSNPSSLPSGYFESYMYIANPNGSQFNIGNSNAFIDQNLTNGAITLTEGLHTVATQSFDQLQDIVAANSDNYFAFNMKFVSTFDFYNNTSNTDLSVFTYDNLSGNIVVNQLQTISITPQIDNVNSFLAAPTGDGTYASSSSPITGISYTAPAIINAATAIEIQSTASFWVNEIQMQLNSNTNTTLSVLSSNDNINWTTVTSNIPGPAAGTGSFGSIKFSAPVYGRYFQILVTSGSSISIAPTGAISLFEPLYLNAGTIRTLPFTLPTSLVWDEFIPGAGAISQNYSINSNFDNTQVFSFTTNSNVNIQPVIVPYIYAIISSTISGADPYIGNIQFRATPTNNEISQIQFSYIANNTTNTINQVIFNAHLVSTQQGITPQLQWYRVKML